MNADLCDSEFTIDQVTAMRELERKLRRKGFAGAKSALQAAHDSLVVRAQALDEHRLLMVGCDWLSLVKGLPRAGEFTYEGADQLPDRFQGELLLGFENLDYWVGHFNGLHKSREGFLEALKQQKKRVLPPLVLKCLYGHHWQKLAPIMPYGATIIAWGTIFRDREGHRLVWGLQRGRGMMQVRLCPIEGEQWDPSQEFALVWKD